MTSPRSDSAVEHTMKLEPPYFANVAEGRKSIELRVADAKRERIQVGDRIVFTCGASTVAVTVTAIRRYASFNDLYRCEDFRAINPDMPLADQLAGVRAIHPPEREALGVLAIAIALAA